MLVYGLHKLSQNLSGLDVGKMLIKGLSLNECIDLINKGQASCAECSTEKQHATLYLLELSISRCGEREQLCLDHFEKLIREGMLELGIHEDGW